MKTVKTTILIFLLAISQFEGFSQNPQFFGRIVHKVSNSPVEKISVSAQGSKEITTSEGEFTLVLPAVVSPGETISLFIQNEQYGAHEVNVVVPRNNQAPVSIPIVPNNKVLIIGRVIDPAGEPLENIQVTVSSTQIVDGVQVPVRPTNSFGEFRIYLNKGVLKREIEYLELLVRDPNKRFGSKKQAYNILAPIEIRLDGTGPLFDELLEVGGLTRIKVPVQEGSLVTIKASGAIRVGEWVGNSTPEGRKSGVLGMSLEGYNIVRQFSHAALMYKVGNSDWQYCGHECKYLSQKKGTLYLTLHVNDRDLSDNIGTYDVRISVE